jgi:hypothetical protein
MPTHAFERPAQRYALLQLADGTFLTAPGDGSQRVAAAPHCGDEACWQLVPAAGARKAHLAHHSGDIQLFGTVVGFTQGDEDPLSDPIWEVLVPGELELPEGWARSGSGGGGGGGGTMRMSVVVLEGPGALPSEYLQTLDEQGFVVCPALLGERLLGRLRGDIRAMRARPELREAISGAPGDSALNGGRAAVAETDGKVDLVNCINESPNFARMATHPVLLHLVSAYIGTPAFRLAHAPAVGIMKPQDLAVGDDGTLVTEPQHVDGVPSGGGWHVDYPLHDMRSP